MRDPKWAEHDWAPYRSARKLFWSVAVLNAIVCLVFLIRWQTGWPGSNFKLWIAAVVLSLATGFAILLRLLRFPCPRCEKPFHWRGTDCRLMNRECLHCLLIVGADPKGSGLVVD